MSDNITVVLNTALAKILRRLARLVLRQGLTFDHFEDIAKSVFIDVAESEFRIDGRRSTASRIAALTGIPRKEVGRVRRLPIESDGVLEGQRNRAARVLTAWMRDERFLDSKGDPLDLPFEGATSFSELVKAHSGDITPRAIADELARNGAITVVDNKYRLTSRSYTPSSGSPELLEIYGTDSAELMDTIAHNLMRSPEDHRLYQQKVSYDNVPIEYLEAFRKLSGRMSQRLLEELDHWLAEHDRDHNPDVLGSGSARIGLMIFQFQDIKAVEDENDE